MRYFFQLEIRMLNRALTEFGLAPILAYGLGLLSFLGLSFLLFLKTSYAPYLYLFFLLSTLLPLSAADRNEFLKNQFSDFVYQRIRFTENSALALPFSLVLVWHGCYLMALIAIIIAGVLVFYKQAFIWNDAVPNPFSRNPFEFLIGFRAYFLLIVGAYILLGIGISVGNFNLGVFALLVLWLISLSFYSEPEQAYFVWLFALSPHNFLWEKIKIGLLHINYLIGPAALVLGVFHPEYWFILVLFLLLSSLYLSMYILVKYSSFPNTMGLPEALVLSICFVIPLFFIFAGPYYYKKSVHQLQAILE